MAFQAFAREHIAQITATAGLVTYALARNKLTPGGIVAGVAVAIIHMAHPWPAFFWLLIAFFAVGTGVTKVSSIDCQEHLSCLINYRLAMPQKLLSRNPQPVARAAKAHEVLLKSLQTPAVQASSFCFTATCSAAILSSPQYSPPRQACTPRISQESCLWASSQTTLQSQPIRSAPN